MPCPPSPTNSPLPPHHQCDSVARGRSRTRHHPAPFVPSVSVTPPPRHQQQRQQRMVYTPAPSPTPPGVSSGAIDLDPCLLCCGQRRDQSRKFYTITDDGFTSNPGPAASGSTRPMPATWSANSSKNWPPTSPTIPSPRPSSRQQCHRDRLVSGLGWLCNGSLFPKGPYQILVSPTVPDALSPLQGQAIVYIGPIAINFVASFLILELSHETYLHHPTCRRRRRRAAGPNTSQNGSPSRPPPWTNSGPASTVTSPAAVTTSNPRSNTKPITPPAAPATPSLKPSASTPRAKPAGPSPQGPASHLLRAHQWRRLRHRIPPPAQRPTHLANNRYPQRAIPQQWL